MKIKITKEIDLIEILKWEDDYDKDTIKYEDSLIEISITFKEEHKEIFFKHKFLHMEITLYTINSTPEEINEIIDTVLEMLEKNINNRTRRVNNE